MKISSYLSPRRVVCLEAQGKTEALTQMLALFVDAPQIRDHAGMSDAMWQREEVLPTGIGLGIGVPHVRSHHVRDPIAALAVLKEGVDYGAIDNQPVRGILMIAMPEGQHQTYLRYLARASRLFQEKPFREQLFRCATAEEVWALIADK